MPAGGGWSRANTNTSIERGGRGPSRPREWPCNFRFARVCVCERGHDIVLLRHESEYYGDCWCGTTQVVMCMCVCELQEECRLPVLNLLCKGLLCNYATNGGSPKNEENLN